MRTQNACTQVILEAASLADLRRFDGPDFPQKISRAEQGARQTYSLVSALTSVVSGVVALVSVGASLVLIEPLVALVLLTSVPPSLWLHARQAKARSAQYDELGASNRLQAYIAAALTGKASAAEVRSYALGPELVARWKNAAEHVARQIAALTRSQTWHRMALGVVEGGVLLVSGTVLLEGLRSGSSDIASVSAAMYAVQMFRLHLRSSQDRGAAVFGEAWFVRDLRELQAENRNASVPVGESPPSLEVVSAHEVTFTYDGALRPSVVRASISVMRGQVVALVGENGSGKTTLAKLLAQLYEPDSGSIMWNGIEARSFRRDEMRERIGMLLQDFGRWGFSLADNVWFGRTTEPRDDGRLLAAVEAAGLSPQLPRLPSGLETPLSTTLIEGGTDLSGGQWQKVALARLIYRQADLVVLDEPSAALDAQAEADLFRRLRQHYANRAVLFISHRFSTVRRADLICVMKEGSIYEKGTHSQLMALNGQYAEMFRLQAGGYLDAQGGGGQDRENAAVPSS